MAIQQPDITLQRVYERLKKIEMTSRELQADLEALAIDASQIVSGSLDKARQHPQTAYKDEANVFTQNQLIQAALEATGTIRSSSSFGWTIGSLANVPRVQYGSSAAGRFSLLNEGNGLADLALDQVYERGRTVAMGEWQAYTPSWTASGSAPSIGNGTLTGRYTQVGHTVTVLISLVAGSTTTFGSGFWGFTVPITAVSGAANIGIVRVVDAGTAFHTAVARLLTTTTIVVETQGATTAVSGTVPFTWTTSDVLTIQLTYEGAA